MKLGPLLIATAMMAMMGACSQQPAAEADNAAGSDPMVGMDNHSNQMAASADDPFAQIDRTMNEKMMAAVGVDPADTWVRKMIAHHEGAVDMSRAVLGMNPTPEVRRMAEITIERQTKEIEELRALMREGQPNASSAELYGPGEMEMHRTMMAASGASPSETWIRKMIEHHRGAVQMSDVVLGQNPPAEVRRMAEITKDDQTREIAELQRLLQNGASNPG